MTISKMIRLEAASLTLAIAMTTLAGCGGSSTSGESASPIPVGNPTPDNKLKDVTIENESANMDKIKKAGEGK